MGSLLVHEVNEFRLLIAIALADVAIEMEKFAEDFGGYFGMPFHKQDHENVHFVGDDRAYSWQTTIGDEALGAVMRYFKKYIVDVHCLMAVELVVG